MMRGLFLPVCRCTEFFSFLWVRGFEIYNSLTGEFQYFSVVGVTGVAGFDDEKNFPVFI